MPKRRNHDSAFKARVALEAVKGARTVSELASDYGVYPTMIHQWIEPLTPLMEWMAPAPGIAMCHIGCCHTNP